MMSVTGKYSDGKIGLLRFIFGYYGRLLLVVLFRQNLVIIDQSSGKPLEETERRKEGSSHV